MPTLETPWIYIKVCNDDGIEWYGMCGKPDIRQDRMTVGRRNEEGV